MDQFSTFYWKKIIISSKTSSDRLKLIYKTKKKEEKKKLCPVSNHYVLYTKIWIEVDSFAHFAPTNKIPYILVQ
jgi:hypothetical protein